MIKVEELTFAYIQKFCDFEKDIILTNHFHTDWEADVLVINQEGFSHEIEIKLSKSDFKNDFKKFYQNQNSGEKFLKHDKICFGDYVCNHFSFLLPMGMVALEEIPQHCGVVEFYHNEDTWKTEFYIRRLPQKIHEDFYWNLVDQKDFLRKLSRNYYFKKLELKGKTEEFIFRNELGNKK